MATFTLQQGKRYRATISLGFIESLASNEMIAGKLQEAGFTEVRVSGNGAQREAEALWPNPDASGEMPSQVVDIAEISV